MRCYLFDIDGTIADLSHRLHHIEKEPKDWDAFFAACHEDQPIWPIIRLASTLGSSEEIVFVSGRSDRCRVATMQWIHRFFPKWKWTDPNLGSGELYMRRDGDHRPDHDVKLELLNQIRADGWDPIMAFDDRNQVVAMWRAAGITCAQVADGNFHAYTVVTHSPKR